MNSIERLVSIIIPTYNYSKYIPRTIESITNQSYDNIDIIVVDDGSTDNTRQVVLNITDLRLRYFYQENQGANAARNRGIREAKGDYLLFLDADDVLEPDHISAYLTVARENFGANIYGPWAKGWFDNNDFIVDFAKGKCPGVDLLEHWIVNWWVQTCCVLWPRTNIELTGGWDETLHANQDGDIAMRALIEGVPFVYAENAPVAKIVMHNDEIRSISSTKSEKTLESRYRVLIKIEQLLIEKKKLSRNYKNALAKKHYYHACESLNDIPELSDRFFREYRRLYGLRKPPGSAMNWLFVAVLGLRRKNQLSKLLEGFLN